MASRFDLDVSSPDKVAAVLRNTAQRYYEDALELQTAWQDPSAGRIWSKIARVLEQAADRIDRLQQ